MGLKKGDFVKHQNDDIHDQWGLGLVLEDEVGQNLPVFFEQEGRKKFLPDNIKLLKKVEEPGDAALYLQNAIYEDSKDRIPFPQALNTFVTRFKGGLDGPVYLEYERDYKLQAHELAKKLLNQKRMADLISQEDWEVLAADIKRVYSKTNLLSSFEMIKLGDAFKQDGAAEVLVRAFYSLLQDEGSVYQRIESFCRVVEPYEIAKWPTVTYPLFILFPEKYLFVKPTMLREAAANRGFEIQYESRVNGNTYECIQNFGRDLFQRLNSDPRPELHARDMIDVQGFIWCAFVVDGWTDEGIAEAEAELKGKQSN